MGRKGERGEGRVGRRFGNRYMKVGVGEKKHANLFKQVLTEIRDTGNWGAKLNKSENYTFAIFMFL